MTAAPNIASTVYEHALEITVPVFVDKFARGWPEHPDVKPKELAQYATLAKALTRSHRSDAHFACYSVPDIGRRLAGPLVFAETEVVMVAFVADIDAGDDEAGKSKATTEWWISEHAKVERLLAAHPGGFVYLTLGGYRVVYRLAAPQRLTCARDAERWKLRYCAWLDYIQQNFDIVGDRACQDWTRLYRLPFVVRDGKRQQLGTIGDPEAIGLWDVVVNIVEPAPPQPRERPASCSSKDAFDIRGTMADRYPGIQSRSTAVAERWVIECPWEHEHTKKSKSGTVVWAYPNGAWEFHCSHSHCVGRNHDDFRTWHYPDWKPFDEREPSKKHSGPEPQHHTRERDTDTTGETVYQEGSTDDAPPATDERAPSYGESEAADREDFDRDPKTKAIYHSQRNITLAIKKLGVTVRYDEFADHELISGLPGFGPRLDDAAMVRLRLAIDAAFSFRIAKEFFCDVISDRARTNRFHPVRDYLDGLRWDQKPRLDDWLITYGRANADDYVRAVGRLTLIAAVRRVRQPGCKFDEMPVLEDEQGTGKSTAISTLAIRDDWFTDDLPLGADTKRQMEATAGKWLIEAGELKGMSKGDVAGLKSYLSRRVDEGRMSYGRKPKVAPRQFVIIGTTNETAGYLKDSTGNRRFWPVRVRGFDLERLRRDRDQLWAEAAHYEADGASIRLDPKLWPMAAVEQESRRVDDPFVELLYGKLSGLTGKIRCVDCWTIVDLKPANATQEQMNRLGSAMRELGWERKQRRFGAAPEWAYIKGNASEREQPIDVEVRLSSHERLVTVIPRTPRNGGST